MDFASEGIERCVIELATVRPESVGEVEIGFQFDADGLSEAWVDEASDLPQSTRDCLAGAVYAVDWSALTDDPVQVTWRFDYSTQEP